jgi:hypothetical protein
MKFEVKEMAQTRLDTCPLGRLVDGGKNSESQLSNFDRMFKEQFGERYELIKNKEDGCRREREAKEELEEQYPESEGYTILEEVYLRDEDGNIVKDPETGEARRIDFVVVDKDGNVVDSIEVTSKTADKTVQSAKEDRIRDNGGNYVKMPDGSLAKIPDDVQTRIERRD